MSKVANQGFEIEVPVEFNTIALAKQEKKKQELVMLEAKITKLREQIWNLEDFFGGS